MDNLMKGFITGFAMIIVSIVLLSAASELTYDRTNKATTNETINLANYRAADYNALYDTGINETLSNNLTLPTLGDTSTDCVISDLTVATNYSVWTLGTDYSFSSSTGIIEIVNTTTTEIANGTNISYWEYTYCPNGYMNQAWGRTILTTNIGLIAIAIMGLGIAIILIAFRRLLGNK